MYGHQQTISSLEHLGPIIEAEIYSSESSFLNIKNNHSIDTFSKVKLLIDTGSNISGLDRQFIQRLQLTRYNEHATVNGVGGTHQLRCYRCILYLPIFETKALPIDVVEGDYRNSPYHGVIGRDVLRFCSFTYDGRSNTFELAAVDF